LKSVAQKEFRADLFYRLGVLLLELPVLKKRTEDIPLLLDYFIKRYTYGKKINFSSEALKQLIGYHWPGNVRELKNFCKWVSVTMDDKHTELSELPQKFYHEAVIEDGLRNRPDLTTLDDQIKATVVAALEKHNWNQTHTAKFLGIPRHKLIYKMEKFNLKRKKKD